MVETVPPNVLPGCTAVVAFVTVPDDGPAVRLILPLAFAAWILDAPACRGLGIAVAVAYGLHSIKPCAECFLDVHCTSMRGISRPSAQR